jgi:hypothetical protein
MMHHDVHHDAHTFLDKDYAVGQTVQEKALLYGTEKRIYLFIRFSTAHVPHFKKKKGRSHP